MLGLLAVTRRRYAVGTTDSTGRYSATSTTATVSISLQPDGDGETILAATAGQNVERSYKAYCPRGTFRSLVEGDSGTLPDGVEYDGQSYEVSAIKDHYSVLPHQAVLLTALQATGEGAAHSGETEDGETVLQDLRTHIKAVSGLGDGRVIVSGCRRPQPSFPYFVLTFPEWEQAYPDEHRQTTTPRLTVGTVNDGDTLAIEISHNGTTTTASLVADEDTTATSAASELADQIKLDPDLRAVAAAGVLTVTSVRALPVVVEDTTGDLTEDVVVASTRGGTRTASIQVRGYGESAAPTLAELMTTLNRIGDGWEIGGAISTEQQPSGRGYILVSTLTVRRTFGVEAATPDADAESTELLDGSLTLQSIDGDITQPLDLEI